MIFKTTHHKRVIKLLSLSLFTMLFFSFSGFSQTCNGNLTVDKNRNSRSADEDGALFTLDFKNLSGSSDSYQLEYIFLEESCANKNSTSNGANVPLDVLFVQNGDRSANSINLGAGGTAQFDVLATVPANTAFNKWSCIQIQVRSDKCGSIVDSQVLKVYVSDPSEN